MLANPVGRDKNEKTSLLPTGAVGVVLVSVFESSSPNRKPVVLLLSSSPMSKYVRDLVTGIEYRLSLASSG
jgi:hypothetical protein